MNVYRTKLRSLLAGMMTIVMLFTATPVMAAKSTTAVVKTNAYMYQSAKTSSKKVKVKKGSTVSVISTKGKWAKVKFGKKGGYMPKDKLKIADDAQPAPDEDETPAPSAPGSGEYQTLQQGDRGEEVKKLQTRLKALNWFYGEIGGNYLSLTAQAVSSFQDAGKLAVTGIADPSTQKLLFSAKAPALDLSDLSTAQPAPGKAQNMDWWTSGISTKFARGSYAVVTDVKTGISFRVYRGGGTNHADVQPATAKDTAAMKQCYGGSWSWNRRAIWVSIGGVKYAASMNGMPHGGGSIQNNNFDGHFCIHFTNSRTHGTNIICPQHQAAIRVALEA